MSPLTCAEVVELVTAYLDGALDEPTAARVAAHLEECDGCSEYVAQVATTSRALGAVAGDGLDPGMRARLTRAFRDFHRGRPA